MGHCGVTRFKMLGPRNIRRSSRYVDTWKTLDGISTLEEPANSQSPIVSFSTSFIIHSSKFHQLQQPGKHCICLATNQGDPKYTIRAQNEAKSRSSGTALRSVEPFRLNWSMHGVGLSSTDESSPMTSVYRLTIYVLACSYYTISPVNTTRHSILENNMSIDPIGASLSDMAARSEPTKAVDKTTGTQNITTDRTGLGDPLSNAPHQVNSLSELANNPIGTAEISDTGATGEVLSGTGNRLPPEIETKNLGATYGGKEGKHGKNLVGNTAAHHKRGEMQDSEDLDLTPQAPYESDRRF